ncbi:MAG: hypothetical protein U9O98_03845 [Asgard group archaeon]|nr:hypothetical protein [Asgard group archaeon]
MKKNFLVEKRNILTFLLLFLFLISIASQNKIMTATTTQEENNSEVRINALPPNPELLQNTADENNITEIGFFDDNYGFINDLVVDGSYIYVALGDEGFAVINKSENSMEVLGGWSEYSCKAISVYNDLVFAANSTGFSVVDISDLSNPVRICNWSSILNIKDIHGTPNFVYILDSSYFRVINITKRNTPTSIYFSFTNVPDELEIAGGYAYLISIAWDNIYSYNITDKENIIQLDDFSAAGNIIAMDYENNFIYYASQNYGAILNATDPANLLSIIPQISYNDTAASIVVKDSYLFVNEGEQIEVFDWRNKTNPQYVGDFDEFTLPGITDYYLYGEKLYAYNDYAIEIIDIADPTNLESTYFDLYNGQTSHVFIKDDYAYVADDYVMEILDISNIEQPTKIGYYYNYQTSIQGVIVRNNYAYLLAGYGFDTILVILDISDPTTPTYLGNITVSGGFYDFYVSDEYAYIAQGAAGVAIIDIYYPDYPQISLRYDEHGDVYGVDMKGNNLIIAAEEYLHVIDMTNPYEPEQISNYTRTGSFYTDVKISGNYAYTVCNEGFDIIDLSNPVKPEKIGQFFNYMNPIWLSIEDRYVYLLDATEGITVYDVGNIAHPRAIGKFDDEADHHSLTVHKGYIFLAEGMNGVRILQTNPRLTIKSPIPVYVYGFGLVFIGLLACILRKRKKQ